MLCAYNIKLELDIEMLFREKKISQVTLKDIEQLVTNQVPESKHIEYKYKLPGNTSGDKKEFLADISSIANTFGGHIIYGIKESKGIPVEISGMKLTDLDSEKLRLDSIIRDGLDPRITNIEIRDLKVEEGKFIIIIEVPNSWSSPHMVTFQNHGKFYARNNAGKYQLDVTELKSAFIAGETFKKNVNSFRVERINNILTQESPYKLNKKPTTLIHIIPFNSFNPSSQVDLSDLHNYPNLLKPMLASGWDHRYNIDGFLTFDNRNSSYAQFFRNGIIETAEINLLSYQNSIPASFESRTIDIITSYFKLLERYQINPPVLILLSMIGVMGYKMGYNNTIVGMDMYSYSSVDRDIINAQDILVENYDSDLRKMLKPLFDSIWNAAGWPYSMTYHNQ